MIQHFLMSLLQHLRPWPTDFGQNRDEDSCGRIATMESKKMFSFCWPARFSLDAFSSIKVTVTNGDMVRGRIPFKRSGWFQVHVPYMGQTRPTYKNSLTFYVQSRELCECPIHSSIYFFQHKRRHQNKKYSHVCLCMEKVNNLCSEDIF